MVGLATHGAALSVPAKVVGLGFAMTVGVALSAGFAWLLGALADYFVGRPAYVKGS